MKSRISRRTPNRARRASTAAAGACLVLLTLAAGTVGAQEAAGDSLAAQLVRMLEGDLSEEVILEWLATQPPPAEPLTADELVALKGAGASDELMKELLGRSRRAAPEPSVPVASPATNEAVPVAESGTVPEPSTTPTVPSAEATDPLVTFQLGYLVRADEPEVGNEGPEWDLFVYLDGLPLTYLTSAELENRPRAVEFARVLSAGKHTIRVLQEKHRRKRGDWQHESRVARRDFVFELVPELPARIEIEFHERLIDYSDPLSFKLTQGEQIVDSGRVGDDAESWPALCEDIEASVAPGKKPNRRQRRELESCVRWETLWDGRTVPSRWEVLDAMAAFEFQPVPKGS